MRQLGRNNNKLRKCLSEGNTITSDVMKGMFQKVNTQGFFTVSIAPSSQSDIEKCFEEFDEAKTKDKDVKNRRNGERRVNSIFNTLSLDPEEQQHDDRRLIMKMGEGGNFTLEKVLQPAKEIVKDIMKAYGDFTGVQFQASQDWVSLVSEPYGQIQSLHADWSSTDNDMKLMAEFGAKEKVVPLSCIYFAQKGAIAINQANVYDTLSMYTLDVVDGVKPLASEASRSLKKGQTKEEILKTNGKLDPRKRVRIGTTPHGCQVKFKKVVKILFKHILFFAYFFNFCNKFFEKNSRLSFLQEL